jgi:DNA-binding TFAR19-related protein (PDSD5 family)
VTLAELARDLGKVREKGGSAAEQKEGYRAAFQQYQQSLTQILTPEQLAQLRSLRDPHHGDDEDDHNHDDGHTH